MAECVALVVAGGRGQRLGAEKPKQYLELNGRTLLALSCRALLAHPRIQAVRVVIHPDDLALYEAAIAGLDLLPPVFGGATRQDSVRAGLESLAGQPPALVLIHDAARPFVDSPLIDRVLDALAERPGAIPAVPVADTLKRAESGRITGTVEREGLWRAQTPQGFRFAPILAAHRAAAGQELTDDAAVAEAFGLEVAVVMGSEENYKVTTPQDLDRARGPGAALPDIRVGTGFDVHRFAPGISVTLCGVSIAHEAALEGHSDADVAMHALTDALLGAVGAGDIGQHFPPSEERWRGAASEVFLRHAAGTVASRGGAILHVDVTIICERPKIGPHRAAMVARLAEILDLDPGRVSVKATTTEGLGFTGRREGIAAQAAATVRF